jgi:hypothetical protein
MTTPTPRGFTASANAFAISTVSLSWTGKRKHVKRDQIKMTTFLIRFYLKIEWAT